MASYLPTTSGNSMVERFQRGAQHRPASVGDNTTLLKINHSTGELTYGAEDMVLPPGHKFVVPLNGFRYGYVEWRGGQVAGKYMAATTDGPAPEPDGPFTKYPEDGPRRSAELELHSVEEPGFKLAATCSLSSQNRMDNLHAAVSMHLSSPEGQQGFIYPVIEVRPASYEHKSMKRTIYHFDFRVVDWLHSDGKTFQSEGAKAIGDANGDAGEPMPWEDEEIDESVVR